MQVHLTVANVVTSVTNSKEFGDRWQRERELLEGDNIIDTIREMLWQEVSLIIHGNNIIIDFLYA